MMTLELFGALKRCSTFAEDHVDIDKIARIYAVGDYDIVTLRDIKDAASDMRRLDIADAIERSFAYRERLNQRLGLHLFWKLVRWIKNNTTLWRLLRPMRGIVKAAIYKVTGSRF